MTPRKFAATSAANDEAARIFLADPVKHAGLRLLWARLYLGLTTIEREYPKTKPPAVGAAGGGD